MKNLAKQKKKISKGLNNTTAYSKKSYKDTKKPKEGLITKEDYKRTIDWLNSIHFTDGKKMVDLDKDKEWMNDPETAEDPDE